MASSPVSPNTSALNLLQPLTFTGVSSYSSDLQQILQRAVQIATLPMQKLQLDQAGILGQEQALSVLGGAVSSLTSSFSSLGLLAANGAVTATTSDPAVATLQLTGSPAPLAYSLVVTSAAAAAQASTALGLPDSDTSAPRANGLYALTLGGNSQSFDLLAMGSGRTVGTIGDTTPSPPDSVTITFANGLTGSITAALKSFFVGNSIVGGAGAGDRVTVDFASDDGSINTGITATLAGGEDAAALANLLNQQIAGNASLAGKVTFSAVNGRLKLVESDTAGAGFTFTSSNTGAVTTGLEPGGAIGGESAPEIAAALNAQVAANPALLAAGVTFSVSQGEIQATGAAGKQFTFTATDSSQGTGFASGLAGRTRVVGYPNTLSGLRDYINSQEAALGVRATVINTSSDPAHPRYDLTLTADQTGAQTLTLNDSAGSDLLPNGGMLGADAVFSINGGPAIINTSNTITGLVPGLNLTITGPSGATPVTLSVQADRSAVESALQDFAAKYNAVVDQLSSQIGKNAGPLGGSSIVRQIGDALHAITGFSSTAGSIQSMAALGLLLDRQGHLSLDLPTFNSLTDQQFEDAIHFLGDTTAGFAGNAYTLLNQLTDPVSGAIQNTQNFLNESDQRLSLQIASQQDYVNRVQSTLTEQISQADTLLAQLESQQTLLTTLFKDQQAIALANTLGG